MTNRYEVVIRQLTQNERIQVTTREIQVSVHYESEEEVLVQKKVS